MTIEKGMALIMGFLLASLVGIILMFILAGVIIVMEFK